MPADPLPVSSAQRDVRAADGADDRRFRFAFEEASDAMLILDNDRRIVEANRSAHALFGLAAGNTADRPLLDWFLSADGESMAAAWRELATSGEAKREHRVIARG